MTHDFVDLIGYHIASMERNKRDHPQLAERMDRELVYVAEVYGPLDAEPTAEQAKLRADYVRSHEVLQRRLTDPVLMAELRRRQDVLRARRDQD